MAIEIETDRQTAGTNVSAWWRATTLAERLQFAGQDLNRTWPVDAGTATHRLTQWRALPAFADEAFLRRRLEVDGVDLGRFEEILGGPPEDLAGQADVDMPPQWAYELEALLAGGHATEEPASDRRAAVTEGFAPFLRAAEAKLLSEIDRRGLNPPVERDALSTIFLPSLASRIYGAISRTVVLEVNVARLRGQLEGETPDERFRHFCALLGRPDFLRTLLEEYVVLTRTLVTMSEQWVVHTTELLERLASDWDAMRGTLLPPETSHLAAIQGDAGDTHRDGRSVTILAFDNGAKVVYKPRPLSIDAHYNELLRWLNERGLTPQLQGVEVIDRGSYGWAHYVEAAECPDQAALQRFYQRQGALLALLYAIDATDLHLENLIAAGEHPMLIDLESLFQHRLSETGAANAAASAEFGRSVMRIGLLPQRVWMPDEREVGLDISALAGAAGQLVPFKVPAFENVGTDEVKVVRKQMRFEGASNLPTVEGRSPRVEDHVDDIVLGFQSLYRLLIDHRDALLSDSGPLAPFAHDEVRAVLRATRAYGMVLGESFHPDVLRDGIDRSRLFERMWDRCRTVEQYFAIAPAEVRQLERCDVPMFISRPDCRHLWSSDGEYFENYFDEASFETVRNRVAALDEADLQRQTWFIKASIASLTLGVSTTSAPRPVLQDTRELTSDGVEAAVRVIADRIDTLAIRGADDVNWIGLSLMGGRQWTLVPLGHDLYSGTLGPLLFLAFAGHRLGDDRYSALARLAHRRILSSAESVDTSTSKLPVGGGYGGPGSIIHALALVGRLWNDDRSLAASERLLPLVADSIARDDAYDVIGGSAGAILNVLALWRATGSPRALQVARDAGDYLLSRSERMSAGIAWLSRQEQSQPLAGFSHGASGIAHALLLLASATGDERYLTAARGALEYERSVYSAEHRNWPDFRTEDVPESERDSLRFMATWCHGAPGIGLARLTAAGVIDEPWIHDDLEAAEQTTFASFGMNDSLCHGDLGNAEFLHSLARMRGDAALQQRLEERVAPIAARIAAGTWYCGTPAATETPGLMSGLAGIGYGLLRFIEPDLPSLLTLADVVSGRPVVAAR